MITAPSERERRPECRRSQEARAGQGAPRKRSIESPRSSRMPRSRGAALFSSWNRPSFIRETAPIFGRTHAQGALERAAHRLARAEAALRGNLVDGGPALFQSPPRPFDAKFLDIARGSDARRSGEHSSEIARAHRHPPCQGVDGEIGPQE